MTVQDLYRVIFDDDEVEIKLNNGITLWYGKNKDIPNGYFDKRVKTIYSFIEYIVIEIA